MSDLPLVSIVSPSYNQADFLEETIQSVLIQTYANIEYIVVDGGSQDGSLAIIQKYASKLDWWVSEPDTGQAEAINKGMAQANGEILAWLNSDDYYYPQTVESAVRIFMDEPEVGLVYANVVAVDENNQKLNTIHYGDWGLEGLMAFQIIGQPSVFFRKSLWEQTGGLDLNLHYLLDHQLWLKMAQLSGMKYVPEVWSAARFHQASKNVGQPAGFAREAYGLVEWMKDQQALANKYNQIEQKIWAGAHRMNGRYLSEAELYRQSLGAYWKGLLCSPGVVLSDWRRIFYTLLAAAGIKDLLPLFRRIQKKSFRME